MAARPFILLAPLVVAMALTGCLTGERPTLADGTEIDAPVGDSAVDAVLSEFAALSAATFTAEYVVTNNFGPVVRDATVAQAGDGRRSITVGQVRFLVERESAVTCTTDEDTAETRCRDGIDDAAISDLQVTHQFYGRSAAVRLRSDAERRIGDTEAYDATFAGRRATCVSIPVSGGSKVYCVLPDGVLAAYQGPDVLIELVDFGPDADETLFDRTIPDS